MPDKGHKSSDTQLLKVNESATGTIKCYFNRNTSDPCLYQSSLLASSWELKTFWEVRNGRCSNPASKLLCLLTWGLDKYGYLVAKSEVLKLS